MTHAEKQMLVQAHAKAEAANRQVLILTELVTHLLERKAGRPSKQDAERVEELKARIHGNQ